MKKILATEVCEGLTVKEVVTTAGGGMLLTIIGYVCTVVVFCI